MELKGRKHPMRCLVIGASRGLGKALATQLIEANHNLLLVSSGGHALRAVADELKQTERPDVQILAMDMAAPNLAALHAEVDRSLGGVDWLFYVAGCMSDDDSGAMPDQIMQSLTAVNYLSAARVINSFLPELEANPEGNIILVSSVRAVRGTRYKMMYSAAKSALESYAQSLESYLLDKPCAIQCYRTGYMDTAMMEGQVTLLPKLSAEAAACIIVAGVRRRSGLIHLPFWWGAIANVLRLMPSSIIRRLGI